MSMLLLYLWTRLDQILTTCVVGIFVSFVFIVIFGVSYGVEMDSYQPDEKKLAKCWKGCKRSVTAIIIAASLFLVIPNSKDAAMIYVVPKMAHSETMQEIAKATPEITKLGLDVLKEKLSQLTRKENRTNDTNSKD